MGYRNGVSQWYLRYHNGITLGHSASPLPGVHLSAQSLSGMFRDFRDFTVLVGLFFRAGVSAWHFGLMVAALIQYPATFSSKHNGEHIATSRNASNLSSLSLHELPPHALAGSAGRQH